MKQTKLYFIAVLAFVNFKSSQAQNFQLSLTGGYAVGLGSNSTELYNAQFDGNGNVTESYTTLKNELGRGMNFQLSGRYMFNDNLGVDLGLNYLNGSSLEQNTVDGYTTDKQSMKLTMYRINPSVVLATELNNITVYSKFGLSYGIGHMDFTSNSFDAQTSEKIDAAIKYDGGSSFGIQGAIGANFELTDNIKLTAEVNYLSANYAPTKAEITTLNYNGINALGNMTVHDKQVNFVDSYDSTISNDATKPSTSIKNYNTVGNVGLQVGICYSFN